MKMHQIRNATLIVTYGGTRFLVDPYLAEMDAYPGFEGTVNSEIRHPRVPLSTTTAAIRQVVLAPTQLPRTRLS